MKNMGRILVLILSLFTTVACMRDDDEPTIPTRPISRLYISTSDYQVNTSLTPYHNVFIVDPADGEHLEGISIRYTSGVKGGAGIVYSPDMQRVLQAPINIASEPDTAVQIMSVNRESGLLGQSGRVMSDLLTGVKGMAYHPSTDQLFLVNSDGSAHIYVYLRPTARNNPAKPTYTIPLGESIQPWSAFMRDVSLQQNDRRNVLYMTTIGADGGIIGFNNITGKLLNDSLVTGVTPDFTLTIPGSNNLLGMSYSPSLDLLVLTDYSDNHGRILFFDDFTSYASSASITPSRIIMGSNTLLKTPVDIEIDGRENAKYLYVADRTERAVLRFLITDEGNVAPNGAIRITTGSLTHTPVGISLDARGILEED